jgi:lipopolysaccharide biosynthesis glycosyltransferase
MKHSTHTVVYASDDRGVTPLGVAIYSLLSNASETTAYKVYVLSNGISNANIERLTGIAKGERSRHRIVFIDVSELAATCDLPVNERWPVTAWTRVFIPKLLPEDERLVLYCDIDTLVCRDLKALFETPLRGKAIGAVLEHVSRKGSHFNERLGMPLDCPGYFNSGVMILDLDVFRKQDLIGKILQYAKEYSDKLTCPDQDALNGALCDNLQPIHHKWNWHDGMTRLILKRSIKSSMNRGATLEDSVESALRPGILHYQGPNKPWRYNHRIERKRYEKAIIQSSFGEYPLPGKTIIKWIKYIAHMPIYWLTWKKIRKLDSHFRQATKLRTLAALSRPS